ncbi:MAG: HD domain-containing protein [Leptospiraceae bacterium]|nr:HD domain-containing protein [Leptospiraceae bacterium]
MAVLNNLQNRFHKILENSQSTPARLICRQLTYVVDSELIQLCNRMPQKDKYKNKFTIIPIGGYGRMELAPSSDIDILFLYKDLNEAELTEILNYFNTYLYNSGKEVGYACRTLEECKVYLDNFQSFYAVLDSRFLLGSEELYLQFQEEVIKSLPPELIKEYNESKIEHLLSLFDSPLHISEPNLKNGPFGLRDIQTIYWLEKSERQLHSLSGLAILPVFTKGEVQLLENAYDFFLKVRIALHVIHGRKVDTLTIPSQPEVAEYLGFGSKYEISSIDKMMKTLYSHERESNSFIATYLDYKKNFNPDEINPIVIDGQEFEKYDNKLYPSRLKNPFNDPETLYFDIVNVFRISQKDNLELSPILLNEIRFASNFLEHNFKDSKKAINVFLEILKAKHKVGKILTLMHHTNILGKLFPEFGECTDFSLFSYHHQYTVDEHTLLILRELDKLSEEKFEHKDIQVEFNEIQEDLHILMLAILIHDAGKVKDGDHCQYGAELATAVGERIGLSEEENDLFRFLVDLHILMSELSTKRDISDPVILNDFVSQVGSIKRLRLLYIFTIIDTKSVGRSVLTNWKKAILKSLFESAYNLIESGQINSNETNLVILEKYLTEKEQYTEEMVTAVRNFANSIIPNAYLNYFTPRRILHHFLIVLENKQSINTDPVLEYEKEPSYVTLTVYHNEDRFFLSNLTGCLSALGINLIGMRSFHVSEELMIDTLQITDGSGSGNLSKEKLDRLDVSLKNILNKEITVEQLLNNSSEWYTFNPVPDMMVEEMIEFNNEVSPEYTVLEVRLPDSMGLLYRIIKSFLELEVKLLFVKISTSSDYAYDSFYLSDINGNKILDKELMESLKQRILNASKEKKQPEKRVSIQY